MLRGVDHIVVAVKDLEAARALYTALGFTVTPTFHHPFGTQSAHIQLDGVFLELLAIEDESLMPPQIEGEFSFARFNLAFLEKRQGASMLVMGSHDRAADLEEFKALGLRTFPPFDFSRKADMSDKDAATIGFALGFVQTPLMMETGFFVCQHKHPPELFWKTAYQTHANGAKSLNSVVFVAGNPSDHHEFLGGFSGQRVMRSTSAGVEMDTANGQLEVLTPAALNVFYGLDLPRDIPEEGGIAALSIAVDLDRAEKSLIQAGIEYGHQNGFLVVKADHAFGCALLLKAA